MRRVALLILALAAFPGRAQEVTLSRADYDQLFESARPLPSAESEPIVPFAVGPVHVEIEVGQESARLRFEIEITLFASGWQEIPLVLPGTASAIELGDLQGRLTPVGRRIG